MSWIWRVMHVDGSLCAKLISVVERTLFWNWLLICLGKYKMSALILIIYYAFVFSDDNYVRYKTRDNVTSLEDCSGLYSDCADVT